MLRNLLLFIGLVTLGGVTNVCAAEAPLKIKVSLYPVSSFEITAPRVEGMGKKTGTSYTGKEFKVAVESLKTGMSLRDHHLHEKLESGKYKFIVVSNVKASGGKGTADILIHGVSKGISFTYQEAGAGLAAATFKLSLKDFNLTKINYKGVGVEDEVEVTATLPYQ